MSDTASNDSNNEENKVKNIKITIDKIPLIVAIINEEGNILYSNKYFLEHSVFSKLKNRNINNFMKSFIDNNEFFQKVDFIIEDNPVSVSLKKTKLKDGMIAIFINSDDTLMNDKNLFITNVSNEIKTPLNGIMATLSLLLDTNLDSSQYNYIDLLRESSLSLMKIVNDILDFSRLESKTIKLQNKSFSLKYCLDEVNQIIAISAKNKNIKLFTNIDIDVPKIIIGDPLRIQQILINFYYNSLKFTNPNGYINTKISYDYAEKFLIFSIKDTGTSINYENLTALFSPYNELLKLKNEYTNNNDSLSLGLAICQEIIKLFKGTVWINQENDTYVLYFKLQVDIDENYFGEDYSLIKKKIIGIYDPYDPLARTESCMFILEKQGTPMVFMNEKDFSILLQKTNLDAVIFSYDKDLSTNENDGKLLYKISQKLSINNIIILSYDISSLPLTIKNDFNNKNLLEKPIKKNTILSRLNDLFIIKKPYEIIYQEHNNVVKLKILIIEENYLTQRIIKDSLNNMGFKKITIRDKGKDAINLIKHEIFDLIIIDFKLNDIAGLKIIELIKEQNDKIYCIAITNGDIKSKNIKDKSFDDFILKPVNYSIFKQKINQFIKQINYE